MTNAPGLDIEEVDKKTRMDEEKGSISTIPLEDKETNQQAKCTQEEWSSLRKVADSVPVAAWFIIICELCERFTFYGITGPFQNYIQFPPPKEKDGQPGAIGAGQQTATLLTLLFIFFCYITPLLGAIVADQYLGRYLTILTFCFIYMIGLGILTLTSIPPAIEAHASLPGLVVAMIVIGLGTGGIKCNVSPLAGDQYTVTEPYVKNLSNDERVIVNPKLTVQSIFHWFYLSINIGALSPMVTTNIEKYHSYWLAYLTPLIMFVIAVIILIFVNKNLIKEPPRGSALLNFFFVLRVAFARDRKLENAKPSNIPQEYSAKHRITWNDEFVDQVKVGLQALKVFILFPFYWVCYTQIHNNLISQAATMRVGKIPNDIMNNLDPIVLIIFTPLANNVLYPYLQRFGITLRPITRIFIGYMLITAAMVYSAIVQNMIYNTGPCYINTRCTINNVQVPNDISVWWQSPSYILIGLSEIFTSITGLNYAYNKAPESLKSTVTAIFLITSAFGALLGLAIVPLSRDPYLVIMYALLGGCSFITGCLMLYFFKKYDDEEAANEKIIVVS